MKNISLAGKMTAILALFVLVSVAMAVVTFNGMAVILVCAQENASVGNKEAMLIGITNNLMDILRIERGLILDYGYTQNDKEIQHRDAKYGELKKTEEKLRAISSEAEKRKLDEFDARLVAFYGHSKEVGAIAVTFDTDTVASGSNSPTARRMRADFKKATHMTVDESKPLFYKARTPIDEMVALYDGQLRNASKQSLATYNGVIWVVLLTGATGLGIGLFIAFIILRSITVPVITLSRKMGEMTATNEYGGTLPVSSNDEIGALVSAFNEMSLKIKSRTDELQGANREMESFIYSVSHDLKTPIITVQGMANLIEKELGDSSSKDIQTYFLHMRHSVLVMNELLEDLLEMSRVGRMDVAAETVNANEVAAEVVVEARANAKEREIEFTIQPDMPAASMNRRRLYQVFSNLVTNAVKFMPKTAERPTIEIGCAPKGDGQYLEFYVKDSGAGLKQEHHEKIFRLFERLHGREIPGTGMGLAFVKKIVESSGGSVRVESAPGKGATFYFTAKAAR